MAIIPMDGWMDGWMEVSRLWAGSAACRIGNRSSTGRRSALVSWRRGCTDAIGWPAPPLAAGSGTEGVERKRAELCSAPAGPSLAMLERSAATAVVAVVAVVAAWFRNFEPDALDGPEESGSGRCGCWPAVSGRRMPF